MLFLLSNSVTSPKPGAGTPTLLPLMNLWETPEEMPLFQKKSIPEPFRVQKQHILTATIQLTAMVGLGLQALNEVCSLSVTLHCSAETSRSSKTWCTWPTGSRLMEWVQIGAWLQQLLVPLLNWTAVTRFMNWTARGRLLSHFSASLTKGSGMEKDVRFHCDDDVQTFTLIPKFYFRLGWGVVWGEASTLKRQSLHLKWHSQRGWHLCFWTTKVFFFFLLKMLFLDVKGGGNSLFCIQTACLSRNLAVINYNCAHLEPSQLSCSVLKAYFHCSGWIR